MPRCKTLRVDVTLLTLRYKLKADKELHNNQKIEKRNQGSLVPCRLQRIGNVCHNAPGWKHQIRICSTRHQHAACNSTRQLVNEQRDICCTPRHRDVVNLGALVTAAKSCSSTMSTVRLHNSDETKSSCHVHVVHLPTSAIGDQLQAHRSTRRGSQQAHARQ